MVLGFRQENGTILAAAGGERDHVFGGSHRCGQNVLWWKWGGGGGGTDSMAYYANDRDFVLPYEHTHEPCAHHTYLLM